MTILKDILKIRYISKKLKTDLEMVCLGVDDVKLLGMELLDTPFNGGSQMMSHGVITEPLKIFGINITSKKVIN